MSFLRINNNTKYNYFPPKPGGKQNKYQSYASLIHIKEEEAAAANEENDFFNLSSKCPIVCCKHLHSTIIILSKNKYYQIPTNLLSNSNHLVRKHSLQHRIQGQEGCIEDPNKASN